LHQWAIAIVLERAKEVRRAHNGTFGFWRHRKKISEIPSSKCTFAKRRKALLTASSTRQVKIRKQYSRKVLNEFVAAERTPDEISLRQISLHWHFHLLPMVEQTMRAQIS